MAKNYKKGKIDRRPAPPIETESKPCQTLSDLRDDNDLWYKILLLIHDLLNISKDKTCQDRLSQTTDSMYIGAPYFSDEEAAAIKAVDIDGVSLEEGITAKLENFFEKRRASGDWRPCGPHDLAPVFMDGFGVVKGEVGDERILGRVRRWGLGTK